MLKFTIKRQKLTTCCHINIYLAKDENEVVFLVPPCPEHTLVFSPVPMFFFVCAGKKKISLYDSQAPICPICQVLLRPGELQEHMETEIDRLAHICLRYVCAHSGIYSHTNSLFHHAAPGCS